MLRVIVKSNKTLLGFLASILTLALLFLCIRWNCIVTTHGPPPMAGHSSSVIGNTMVVFGGSLGARQMYSYHFIRYACYSI